MTERVNLIIAELSLTEPSAAERQRAFWLARRQALLMELDAIERYLDIKIRTAALRSQAQEAGRERRTDRERS